MQEWLITYGPMKQVASGFEKAQTAEKNGKLGEAFTLYTQIAEILPDTALCRTAKKSAMRLATQAETELEQLKEAFDKKPYAEVTKALTTFRDTYSNSTFETRVTQLLSGTVERKGRRIRGARTRSGSREKLCSRPTTL